MDINFIVSPIVGGVIGGFANWLAIQMLFFPLTEKKVLGVKVPFTPGIVPKERRRIAQSVGDTVANYFLSEEVIVNAVVSPEMEKEFKSYIEKFIVDKQKSEETIVELITKHIGKTEDEIINVLNPMILNFVFNQLKSSEVVEAISNAISNYIDEIGDKKISQVISEENIKKYEEVFADKIAEFINSKTINNYLGMAIVNIVERLFKSKKTIKETVPEEIINDLKAKVFTNSDKIANLIIEYISSSSIQFKFRKALKNKFEESFKLRMVSKVIDIEKIFESFLEEAILFLEQPDGYKEIGKFVINLIDSISEKNIKDLSEEYDIDINSNMVNILVTKITTGISDPKYIKTGVAKFIKSDIMNVTIKDALNGFSPKLLENKNEFIQKILADNLDKIPKSSLEEILKTKLKQILESKVSSFCKHITKKNIEFIQDIGITNFKKLIKGESDRIIKVLDISRIVEDRINNFNIGEMEGIMLGIIKKDIMTMRLFEAGIGFLIGFIIPAYPYLFRYLMQLFKLG